MLQNRKSVTLFNTEIFYRMGLNVFDKTFVTLVNFNDREETININLDFHPILDMGFVAVSSSALYEVG